jgi:hypothetical protein
MKQMNLLFSRHVVVVLVFAAIAVAGIVLSLSAPYQRSDDEYVYLTGTLQAQGANLPDSYMLEGYDYGPYAYPNLLLAFYEDTGHETFKSLFLFLLVMLTGLSAYALFRVLKLDWIPSLLLSVMLLLPRTAAGTEFFGVLTFREAIGRSLAVPLCLIATAFILDRIIKSKPLWPVFVLLGFGLFLHPVTVTLFAFVALAVSGVTLLLMRTPFWKVVREVMVSGCVFIASGFYFFIDVCTKLSANIAREGVSALQYAEAVVFRNAWEFTDATLLWYRHMLIVSVLFLVVAGLVYGMRFFTVSRERFMLVEDRIIAVWGSVLMASALIIALSIPALNLYLMESADASYMFQQWSRISKFYYIGLFVLLVPVVRVLWGWYSECTHRFRHMALVGCVVAGVLSSSFFFEIGQFVVGYKNYTTAYIPQVLSSVADDIRPEEYAEVCTVLALRGATSQTEIIATDFAFRYYCLSNLYVTNEEGGAFTFHTRADLIDWHARLRAQGAALGSGQRETIESFAKEINAKFIVVSQNKIYTFFQSVFEDRVLKTSKHYIIPL